MNNYQVEITDLFGGELNYSWVRRETIGAKSLLGAVQKVSRLTGLNFRKQYGTDWDGVYHSTSKLTGFYIEQAEE